MRKVTGFAVISAAFLLLLFPSTTKAAVSEGLKICAESILPSLFPFFTISNLMIGLGITNTLSKVFAPLMKQLFHLPGSAAPVFVVGLLGGYPAGAQTAASLYENGSIDRDTAERALVFSNNAGPAFVFGIAGAGVFQSVSIGAALYGLHLASAILSGIILRPPKIPRNSAPLSQKQGKSFLSIFPGSVRQAGETTINVCIFVLFFRIMTEFISLILPPDHIGNVIALGSLELAGGTTFLRISNSDFILRFCVMSGLIGWGGLCVHSQTAAILQKCGLSCKRHLLGKGLQAIISTLLAFIVAPLLPLPVACISVSSWMTPVIQLIILLLFGAWIWCMLKITSGKVFANRL